MHSSSALPSFLRVMPLGVPATSFSLLLASCRATVIVEFVMCSVPDAPHGSSGSWAPARPLWAGLAIASMVSLVSQLMSPGGARLSSCMGVVPSAPVLRCVSRLHPMVGHSSPPGLVSSLCILAHC